MLGKTEGQRRKGQLRMRWLDSIIDLMGINLSKLQKIVKDREAWRAAVHGVTETRLRNWTWNQIFCQSISPVEKIFTLKKFRTATPNYVAACLLDKLISEGVCKISQDLPSESPELNSWDFPGGGPVFKTPYFHCSGHGFHPWFGTKILNATWVAKKKKNLKTHDFASI